MCTCTSKNRIWPTLNGNQRILHKQTHFLAYHVQILHHGALFVHQPLCASIRFLNSLSELREPVVKLVHQNAPDSLEENQQDTEQHWKYDGNMNDFVAFFSRCGQTYSSHVFWISGSRCYTVKRLLHLQVMRMIYTCPRSHTYATVPYLVQLFHFFLIVPYLSGMEHSHCSNEPDYWGVWEFNYYLGTLIISFGRLMFEWLK